MEHYATNLKRPLRGKNNRFYDNICYFARYFERTTRLPLASPDAQIAVFGRRIGDPDSIEVQCIMLMFLQHRLKSSVQGSRLPNETKVGLINEATKLTNQIMNKYYRGTEHNLLIKMRRRRAVVISSLFLMTVGIVLLFAVHIRTRIDALCATTATPIPEIALIAAISLSMFFSLLLFVYEAARPKDFNDYGKLEVSQKQLLDKFSPNIMRNTKSLCAFSLFNATLILYLCFGTINGEKILESQLELGLAGTIAILTALSLVIIVASHCDMAVGWRAPSKINHTQIEQIHEQEEYITQ